MKILEKSLRYSAKNSLYILKIDNTYCIENTFSFLAAKRQENPDKYVEKKHCLLFQLFLEVYL